MRLISDSPHGIRLWLIESVLREVATASFHRKNEYRHLPEDLSTL